MCKIDIESVLSEVMNEKIKIDAIVTEKEPFDFAQGKEENDLELQNLTAAFGGEIVS